MFSIKLSFIDIGVDDVVVEVESEADDADESFLHGFLSFYKKQKNYIAIFDLKLIQALTYYNSVKFSLEIF